MKFLQICFLLVAAISIVGCQPEVKKRAEGEKPEVSQETEQTARPDFGSEKP
jgi:hypothetical protein